MTDAAQVLWGSRSDPRQHLRRTVGWFAAMVAVGYLALAVVTHPPVSGVVDPRLAESVVVLLTFYGPPVAAVASTARGGGLVAALAVGPVPGVVFWVVATLLSLVVGTTGDAPAWALAIAFAAQGMAGTVVGYAVVAGGRLALRRYREG